MCKKENVDDAVIDFCNDVIKEPLIYFSEVDLHALLIEKLYENIPSLINKMYNTKVHRGKDSKSLYKTRAVHCEYGGGEKRRIDIVIFDEKDTAKITTPNLTIDYTSSYLKPLFGFELGTEKIGLKNIKKHVESDIRKLKNSEDTGYLIHIFRDITTAPLKTKTRVRKDKIIEKEFKEVFSTILDEVPKNVKIIAILLRPFRAQTKTHGKCLIFDKETKLWTRVGKPVIDETLKKQLH